jgi:hypothetical protein
LSFLSHFQKGSVSGALGELLDEKITEEKENLVPVFLNNHFTFTVKN